MGTRAYKFINGPQSSTLPTVSTAVTDSDFPSYGQIKSEFAKRNAWYDQKSNAAGIRAIPYAGLVSGTRLFLTSDNTEWYYNPSSSAADDGSTVLKPTDNAGNGRWLQLTYSTGGGGGGGSGSGLETFQQKLDGERYGILTSPLARSIGSSFAEASNAPLGRIVANYTDPAVVAVLSWAPTYLSNSDKNLDSATGWTPAGDFGAISVDSTNKICGTGSLKATKAGAATDARFVFDRGAADFFINENWELICGFRISTALNFTNIEVRINVDNTNWQTFTASADDTGVSVTTGAGTFKIMKFDLSTGGVATGTGWDITKAFRYFEIGGNWSSAAQTCDFNIDAVQFSLGDIEKYVQPGLVFDVYNNSDIVEFQIDDTNTQVSGTVDLVAALGANFAGGTATTLVRDSISIPGDGTAIMVDGLSGDAADFQKCRVQRVFPMSVSADFSGFTSVDTNMFFEVKQVNSSTDFDIYDESDSTSELVAPSVLHVIAVRYDSQGKPNYRWRSLDLTIGSSSFSAGVTNIVTGTNTGIAAGDIVILKALDVRVSLVGIDSNENFVTPTTNDIVVDGLGLQYPGEKYVLFDYELGGENALVNRKGVWPSLAQAGTVNKGRRTLNGEFGAGPFPTIADYFYLPGGGSVSQLFSGDSGLGVGLISFSFWIEALSNPAGSYIFANSTTNPGGNSWYLSLLASNAIRMVGSGGATLAESAAISNNVFTHVAGYMDDGVGSGLWINTVPTVGAVPANTYGPGTFSIGTVPGAGSGPTDTAIIYQAVGWSGYKLTDADVKKLFNRNLGRLLGSHPGISYRFSQTGMSGQKGTVENKLSRTTDVASPFITKTGIIPG